MRSGSREVSNPSPIWLVLLIAVIAILAIGEWHK